LENEKTYYIFASCFKRLMFND